MIYVTIWSGALEAAGQAPGLSSYQGHSALHSPDPPRESESELADPVTVARRGTLPRGVPGQFRHAYRSLDAAILPLLEQGLSYRAIGRALGCSWSRARRIAMERGIPSRKARNGSKDAEIASGLGTGESLHQIAKSLGVSRGVVRRVRQKGAKP